MGHGFLYEALPFLEGLSKEEQGQFVEYFRTAPLWLIDSFRIEKVKKGTVFTREGEPADTVFFIAGGTIAATDYRMYGMPYDYRRYNRVYAFGAMEILINVDKYMTTLRVASDCTIAMLPRAKYEKWLFSDINALRYETMRMGSDLLNESRDNRLFLFVQGPERLALLFVKRYEQYGKKGVLSIKRSRQNLADETGLCIKTISRGVKRFMEEGLITKEGNQIMIDRVQYEGLKQMISSKIYLD